VKHPASSANRNALVMRDKKNADPEASQRKAFVDAARSLECDESEERFDAALRKVAAHKPPDKKLEHDQEKANPPNRRVFSPRIKQSKRDPLSFASGSFPKIWRYPMLRSLIVGLAVACASLAEAKDDNINRHVDIHFVCKNQTVDVKNATDFYLNLSYRCRPDGDVQIDPKK